MTRTEDLKNGLEEFIKENVIASDHWIMFFLGHIAGSIALIADEMKKGEKGDKNERCDDMAKG